MTYNQNQNNFLIALAKAIAEIKDRGVFLVADGQVSFVPADLLYRMQDAVIEGIAGQGHLPSHAVTGGYMQINETVKTYDPEKEIVILLDSVVEIMSREKIENAVKTIANAPTSPQQDG